MIKHLLKNQALFISAALLLTIGSCTKGHVVPIPEVGFLSILKFTVGDFTAVQGTDHPFIMENNSSTPYQYNSPGGINRFRFYETNVLVLDTQLTIKPNFINNFVLFKPNRNTLPHVYDQTLNGLDKERLPDAGYVKFSVANFSEQFPGKVNIYVTTTTVINNKVEEIQVAEFLNTSNWFTGYKIALLGSSPGSTNPSHAFKLIIKDTANQATLATGNFTLPRGIAKGTEDLPYGVYLVYFQDNAVAPVIILMNK